MSPHLQARDKLMGQTMPKFMQTILQSGNMPEMQKYAIAMFGETTEILFPGKKFVLKDDVEPQCEIEEVK